MSQLSQTWRIDGNDDNEVNTLLMVHELPAHMTAAALRHQFARFGSVERTNVHINQRGRPVGFVQMRSVHDCTSAISALHCHPPLFLRVQMSRSQSERQRLRRQREESRQFEDEMRPITEAKRREFAEHQRRMLQLTRDFVSTLGQAADAGGGGGGAVIVGEQDDQLAEAPDGGGAWPLRPGQQRCLVCAQPTAGYCQRCRTPYCCTQCQSQDWPHHQTVCGSLPTLTISLAPEAGAAKHRSVEYSPGKGADALAGAGDPAGGGADGGRTVHARANGSPQGNTTSPTPLRRPRTTSGGDGAAGSAPPKKAATMSNAPAATSDLHKSTASRAQQARVPPPAAQNPMPLGAVQLREGQRYEVVVVYAPDPSAVFLRLRDQLSQVTALEEAVRSQVARAERPTSYAPGQYCAARFQDTWYRGEVECAQPHGKYRVFFVDWGNHATVDLSDMTKLNLALSRVQPQAVRATLPWRPTGEAGGWGPEQWAGVVALDGQPLTASVISGAPDYSVVLFNEDGKSVLDMISEAAQTGKNKAQPSDNPPQRSDNPPQRSENPPQPSEPPPQPAVPCPVAPPPVVEQPLPTPRKALPPRAQLTAAGRHTVGAVVMTHPQHLTAQLRDRSVHQSYLVTHQLVQKAAAVVKPLSAPPAVDAPVAVLCKAEDGAEAVWHRAAVLAVSDSDVTASLLDWGCRRTVPLDRVRSVPSILWRAAAIGVQFGLHGLAADMCCDPQQLQFFRDKLAGKEWIMELAGDRDGVAQVKLHSGGDGMSYCFNEKMLARLDDSKQKIDTPVVVNGETVATPEITSEISKSPLLRRVSKPSPLKHPSCPPLFISELAEPALEVGAILPFMITHVERADLFYAMPLTETSVDALDRAETLASAAMRRQPPPPACRQPQRQQLVLTRAAPAAGDGWTRAAVLQPLSGGSQPAARARVLLLDHGCVASVPAGGLHLLPTELTQLPAAVLPLTLQGAERMTDVQRQLVTKFLTGDGSEEESLLELTVVSVGRAGAPSVVSCADINEHLLIS